MKRRDFLTLAARASVAAYVAVKAPIVKVTATIQEWFDVKHYGAIGDGIHDDTAAIQRAVDAQQGPWENYVKRILPYKYRELPPPPEQSDD